MVFLIVCLVQGTNAMRFVEIEALILSDGIHNGDEYDPYDRSGPLYIGLDDYGFKQKSEFVAEKMEQARRGEVSWFDATTFFVPGDLRMFKVIDDDGECIGYYMLNDWNRELQSSEGANAKTVNKAFAYSDEVQGLNDSEILMFLTNRILNADARNWYSGHDTYDTEVVIAFDKSRTVSLYGFPKSACNVASTELDKRILSAKRK